MTAIERTARKMIAKLTLEELINEWEKTTDITDENIYTVRGWLMDELENRNPEGFEKWLDSENCEDGELKNYMM